MTTEQFWENRAVRLLQGKTISKVRYATKQETHEKGWFKRGIIMTLSDGMELEIQADDEGNESGVIAYFLNQEVVGILPSL